MDKKQAKKSFTKYLNEHQISYIPVVDNGAMQFAMAYAAENTPGKCVESCIWFYEEGMEARVYYSSVGAKICRESSYINELFRLLNFINARVFLSCSDGNSGLYSSHLLYMPRMYLTTDGCFDITITTFINYDFYEIAPVETEDYLTAYCPELLDRLAMPVYGVLLGKISVDMAEDYIKREILKEHAM